MVGITPLPTPPSTSDPTNFNARADAFLGALPAFVTEANAYAAWLAAAAQPAAAYIAYTWVSSTSGDPGNGCVGGNNATQNASTSLRLDDLDALGINATAIVDSMDDSTNPTTKGFLRVQKVGDPSKWLLFRVNGAVVNSTGYRTVPAAIVAGSAANPFTVGDAVVASFTATGDQGAQGPTSLWTNVLSGGSINGQTLVTLSPLPSGYADLRFEVYATSGGTPDFQMAFSTDGTNFSTLRSLFSMGATAFVSIIVHDYKGDRPQVTATWSATAPGSSPDAQGNDTAGMSVRADGGLAALRLAIGGFSAGSTLYQPRAR